MTNTSASLPLNLLDDADMESDVALPASQVECQELRKGLTRLPADTPRTPGPKSVDFQQFCDRLRTDLPALMEEEVLIPVQGLSQETWCQIRRSAPLEYEVTPGERTSPLGVDL